MPCEKRRLAAFLENFRGYNLRELWGQAETWRQFCGMRQAGGCFIRPGDGQIADFHEAIEADVSKVPLMVGTTRELALGATIGSLIFPLFHYRRPCLGLTQSQQRLVLAAFDRHTDEELSAELNISLFAVKKGWREINHRLKSHVPEALKAISGGGRENVRGKQRRHHLVAYLRDHPEELRPVERQSRTARQLVRNSTEKS